MHLNLPFYIFSKYFFVLNIQPQSIYSFIYPIVIIFSMIIFFVGNGNGKKNLKKTPKKQLLCNDELIR